MAVQATWLGHSAVLIEDGATNILIDPYLTDNPMASAKPEDLKADLLLLTHDHADHVGDTEHFLKKGATFVGVFETAMRYANQGYTVEPMNTGGSITTNGVRVHMVEAIHSYGEGVAAGFVVETGGRQIYHAGDTALTMNMRILNEFFDIDLAFVPIGDRFTMGADSAATAVEWCGAKKATPIHYGTWPPIQGNPDRFADLIGGRAAILRPGESVEL
ncbi:MAG: metal-dependent hydrolase [Candidatus Hydrogenedentota bacterium]